MEGIGLTGQGFFASGKGMPMAWFLRPCFLKMSDQAFYTFLRMTAEVQLSLSW